MHLVFLSCRLLNSDCNLLQLWTRRVLLSRSNPDPPSSTKRIPRKTYALALCLDFIFLTKETQQKSLIFDFRIFSPLLCFFHCCLKQLDRFIPNRSAMDFGYAHYMLTEGRKGGKENPVVTSPSREAYQQQLADAVNMTNRTRILAFKNKPPVDLISKDIFSPPPQPKSSKPKRYIPQVNPTTST